MKIFTLFFIFFVTPLFIVAQTTVGFKGGYQMCKVSFNPIKKLDYVSGYNGGIALKYVSQPHLGFIIEVNYSQRGWNEYVEYENFGKLYYQRQLNYIEIPMFSHFYLGDKTRIYLNIGPSFAYQQSFNEKYNIYEIKDENDKIIYQRDIRPVGYETIKYEFGIAGGLGFEQKTRVGGFNIEARITHGLTNIISRPDEKSTDYSQNQVFGAYFIYYFEFLKKTDNKEETKEQK